MSLSPNKEQIKVIEHSDGPLLVIAGPGSGKTFTLVERAIYLIQTKKLEPCNLLISTFTEKAAKELITRISNRLIDLGLKFNVNEMYVGTLHSICLRLLKEYREFTRLGKNYTVLDQFDQQYFLYQRIRDFEKVDDIDALFGRPLSRWKKSETLLKWINKISEEHIDIDKMAQDEDVRIKALAACFNVYEKQLAENDTLDFSTIQLEALRLITNNPAVLETFQNKIKYLMIDEYQDTNTIQESIILKLAGASANICVVGDDDQGLYRFRGATIRNILEFPNNFPKGMCQQAHLTTNYRSHPNIISFYNEWMNNLDWTDKGRTFRYEKTIQPPEHDFVKIPTVFKVSADSSQKAWFEEIHQFLQALKANGLSDWNQVAFLFRSVKNPKVKALSKYLESQGIAVYSPRSDMFFEREEIQLIIGALLFLFRRYGDIRQWDETIQLSIWDYYDDCLRRFAGELRKHENEDLLKWCRTRAKQFYPLSETADFGFSGLFYQLLQFPLFGRYLMDDGIAGTVDGRAIRNLAIFSNLLVKFEYLHHIIVLNPDYLDKNLTDLFNQFMRYLKDGGLNEYEDDFEIAPSGCVSFLTIHQAKGLEFPVVLVGSMESVPRKQYSDLDETLQDVYYQKPVFEPLAKTKYYDFWRLFYTAFSRAQNLLALTTAEKQASGRGSRNVPSKYFSPVYNPLQSWRTINLTDLSLESIKEVNIKREYSFTSHIILYENCARQYRFFKDLAFAPVRQNPVLFGMVVHQTIEDVHKAALRGEQNQITTDQVTAWFNYNYFNLSRKERVYLAPQQQFVALEHVLRYVGKQNGDWSHIKEAEVEISLVKDQYILKGQVDLIQGDDNTVEIVDFKSEKKPDLHTERERVNRYRRQLEIYAHVVEERLNHKVSKMHLYYTGEETGNPFVSFDNNSKRIDQTIAVIDKTVNRIEAKDYQIVDRPDKHCKNCDIRFYCDSL